MVMNHKGEIDHELEWILNDPFQAILATNIRTKVVGGFKEWKPLKGYEEVNMNTLVK
jgi:hypothetical protein